MEFGDLPALMTSAGALLLGLLAYLIPSAKDRAAAKDKNGDPVPAVEQGRVVDVETYTDDFIDLLRQHGLLQAELAAAREIIASLKAERVRLLAAIARRDDKIKALQEQGD